MFNILLLGEFLLNWKVWVGIFCIIGILMMMSRISDYMEIHKKEED
jgi:hypothetical protein